MVSCCLRGKRNQLRNRSFYIIIDAAREVQTASEGGLHWPEDRLPAAAVCVQAVRRDSVFDSRKRFPFGEST